MAAARGVSAAAGFADFIAGYAAALSVAGRRRSVQRMRALRGQSLWRDWGEVVWEDGFGARVVDRPGCLLGQSETGESMAKNNVGLGLS